jgi:hypothetical protein
VVTRHERLSVTKCQLIVQIGHGRGLALVLAYCPAVVNDAPDRHLQKCGRQLRTELARDLYARRTKSLRTPGGSNDSAT